ncbi:origin recognition complex subunit 3 [Tetranychus urticae]|uniref:Uncharacterized protein n=1 Tax=Tetranychus urticae TaxID=32264 RepID=T1KSI3_TETUR|nr:origin recognition complex subunit 3 [Tetranychus urticae]
MNDESYTAASSAHSYKVIKPNRRKSKTTNKIDCDLSYDDSYHHYISKLNKTYSNIEKEVFDQLLGELKEFVIRHKSVYDIAKSSSFRYTPCAVVSMSANINNLSSFSDLLIDQIEEITSLQLVVTSDDVRSIPDFVKLVQDCILDYLGIDRVEFPYSFYSVTAKFFNEKIHPKLPMVVIFKDFDCISQTLLSDLFMLMHENLEKMPVILICCQSSDIVALNMRLPSKATNNLKVENFSCRPTKDFFYLLLDDISFSTETSFKLGPKVLKHLINVYKLWDTSLSGAFRRVKLCVFEHFYNKKYAKLCCAPDEIDSTVSTLTDDELNSIRDLDSIQRRNFPKESKIAKSQLKKELRNFLDHLEDIYSELKFYHLLKESLFYWKKLTFIEDTWIPFLDSEKLSDGNDFHAICDRFCGLDSEAIISLMDNLSRHIDSVESTVFASLKKHYKDFETKTQDDQQDNHENEINPNGFRSRLRSQNGIVSSPYDKKISRTQLRSYIASQQKPKVVRKFQKWKDEFLDLLREEIDKISNPLHLPYNEIFFFNDIGQFEQLSMPTTRHDTLFALENPEKVFICKCCQSLNRLSPDISIIYSIYCDLYRVANLKKCYDTFKEFVSQHETRVSPRKRAKKDATKCDEKGLLARFISAIGDLEYLGLIRAHPRKVDHIERLVWPLNDHTRKDHDSDEQISKVLKDIKL